MASIRQEVLLNAPVAQAWDALRDVGALHTRLVPGFVIDTKFEDGVRIATFANGAVVREPIVDVDEEQHRVWCRTDSAGRSPAAARLQAPAGVSLRECPWTGSVYHTAARERRGGIPAASGGLTTFNAPARRSPERTRAASDR